MRCDGKAAITGDFVVTAPEVNPMILALRENGIARLDSLTSREREVMGLVTGGLMNKQIAGELGVSEITVKLHRGQVMRKMGAKSPADLVRMAETLGVRRIRERK